MHERPATPVVFVAGAGFSGSTLLEQALSQLDGFASAGEMYWLWVPYWSTVACECGRLLADCDFWRDVMNAAYGREQDAVRTRVHQLGSGFVRNSIGPALRHAAPALRVGVAFDELAALLAPLYHAVALRSGASTIVDATKVGLWGLAASRAPGVDVRVVHLVRDPRSFVSSDSRPRPRANRPADELRARNPARSVVTWTLANLQAELLTRAVPRHMVVLYSSLTADFAATIARIARWSDVDTGADHLRRPDAVVVETVGHAIGGNPSRPGLGTTSVVNRDVTTASSCAPAVSLWSRAAGPLWRRYERAAELDAGRGAREPARPAARDDRGPRVVAR